MKRILFFAVAFVGLLASAEIMDRPSGIKLTPRMTLRPYVAFSYTYDSNIDSARTEYSGSSWSVSPGASLSYEADDWSVVADGFYRYHAYSRFSSQLNESSYGENLRFNWSNSGADERGWSFMLGESYTMLTADDSVQSDDGRGLWRDRATFTVNAGLEHRFTQKLHGDINGSIYWLDYENDAVKYAPLYGWGRWTVGASVGYMLTHWSDVFVSGSYQQYDQDDAKEVGGQLRSMDNDSKGYTIHVGVQTRATEKISYRLSGGLSHYEYGDANESDSFTYSVSGHWRISETWSTMLAGSSYYQPSEREYGSSVKPYTISWGLAHSMVKGKMNATFDTSYRYEKRDYYTDADSDYDEQLWTLRLGLNYTLNRFLGLYAHGEYQTETTSGGGRIGNNYDYDRWRLTVGFRLTY